MLAEKIIDKTANQANKPLALVVDDEESICSTLSGVLQDESFDTLTAFSGEEALEKVNKFKPELVFLDIWMADWDGIETLEYIKAASPKTEVIMISGHATISNALEATKRGAFDFIEKPLDLDSVILSAKRALEHRATTAESTVGSSSDSQSLPVLSHPGVNSTGFKGKNVGQRTLKSSAILYGQCLHSGRKSGLVLEPLPANSGIHFAKIGDSKVVPAFVDNVGATGFATTIRSGTVSAATIEHLMSALHAYKISNLLVKCNGEVPIFDGSSMAFAEVIESVGIEEQGGDWFEIAPDEVFEYETPKGETITFEPSEQLEFHYQLDYPEPVGKQEVSFVLESAEKFVEDIAPARTFGFMKDIEQLQKAGLAAGGRLDNFILIGSDGVINTELRFDDELVRHKILDCIGDIFLLGRPIRAKITARMTGHSDNVAILRLLKDKVLAAA